MLKVDNTEKYQDLFKDYHHSIPVIYASLNGQYQGELYVDDRIDPKLAVLFTPFDFHFVAGNEELDGAEELIEELIFKDYLLTNKRKEAVFFAPHGAWDKLLSKIFAKYKGLEDVRKNFRLKKEAFQEVLGSHKIPQGIEIKTSEVKDELSRRPYPKCTVFLGEEEVSYCSGFMLGGDHAEIDLATKEDHQGKGYGRLAAITLLETILKRGLEPDWCTWPYREASQALAKSLGFELAQEVKAHIWVEEVCGPLGVKE